MRNIINKLYEDSDLEKREYINLVRRFEKIRDSVSHHFVWHKSRPWEWATVILATNPQSGWRVLDIGGARSPLSFYLREIGCSVVVLDLELPDPYVPLSYYAEKDIEYIIHDARSPLPFSKNEFDCIYSTNVLEHLYTLMTGSIPFFVELLGMWFDFGLRVANTVDFYGDNVLPSSYTCFNKQMLDGILVCFGLDVGDYDTDWAAYYRKNFPIFSKDDFSSCNQYQKFSGLYTCASLII